MRALRGSRLGMQSALSSWLPTRQEPGAAGACSVTFVTMPELSASALCRELQQSGQLPRGEAAEGGWRVPAAVAGAGAGAAAVRLLPRRPPSEARSAERTWQQLCPAGGITVPQPGGGGALSHKLALPWGEPMGCRRVLRSRPHLELFSPKPEVVPIASDSTAGPSHLLGVPAPSCV